MTDILDPVGPAIETNDADLLFRREVAASLLLVNRELFTSGTTLAISDTIKFSANQLALRLEKLLYTTASGIIEFECPAGPWEHFRSRYFKRNAVGRWFLRRKPVRMHYERRSSCVAFPESTVEFPPELGRPVYLIRDEHHYID